jgi:hypothetical protein
VKWFFRQVKAPLSKNSSLIPSVASAKIRRERSIIKIHLPRRAKNSLSLEGGNIPSRNFWAPKFV